LLGVFALLAEWRALIDPSTPPDVARIKLLWWRDEVQRSASGSPLHPISRFIVQMPRARSTNLLELLSVIDAATRHVDGAPLERGVELAAHADALGGTPLRVAADLSGPRRADSELGECTAALAAGDYLSRAVAGHRRDSRAGRILFPVDELLAAGIDNDDLTADASPPRLLAYLETQRHRADVSYARAAAVLRPAERPELRHLMVFAALGAGHLRRRVDPSRADFRFADLYNAWSAARRGAAAA